MLRLSGGLLLVSLRVGLRASLPAWVVAVVLGPVAYLLVGPQLFGPGMLYYTVQVPQGWTELNLGTFTRLVRYFGRYWLVLVGVCGWAWVGALPRWRAKLLDDAWLFMLPFAVGTSLLGALDAGSENNNFIPLGTWMIVLGTGWFGSRWAGLPGKAGRQGRGESGGPTWTALSSIAISFALLFYSPRDGLPSPGARAAYADLVQLVQHLPGDVYMPDSAQLSDGKRLKVPVHAVALDDLVRGGNRGSQSEELVLRIMRPVAQPDREQFVLANGPLDARGVLGFLAPRYELVRDFGDRFRPLRTVPGRFSGHSWPRYLHRRRTDPAAPLSAEKHTSS